MPWHGARLGLNYVVPRKVTSDWRNALSLHVLGNRALQVRAMRNDKLTSGRCRWLAVLLLAVISRAGHTHGELSHRIEQVDSGIEDASASAMARADIFMNEGLWRQAIVALEPLTAHHELSPVAHLMQARCHRHLGQLAQAEAALSKADHRHTEPDAAWQGAVALEAANLARVRRQFDVMEAHFWAAARHSAATEEDYVRFARTFLADMRDAARALRVAEAGAEIYPLSVALNTLRVDALELLGRCDEALDHLRATSDRSGWTAMTARRMKRLQECIAAYPTVPARELRFAD